MRFIIITYIQKDFKEVASGFDLHLFKALKPPGLSLDVTRFDGCKKGDEVHLIVGAGPIKKNWISHITDDYENENEIVFVDEGHVLPPPLKTWKHTHKIVKTGNRACEIHDDIHFSSGNKFLDALLYPAMKLQFSLRKPVYRKYFDE